MQFIYDHMIASIVAGVVILMLATMQIDANETSVEAMSFYDAKQKQVMFTEVLQTDLTNIGGGRAATETMIEDWTATTMDFWTQTDSSGTVDRVTYALVQTGTQAVSDSTYTTYQVQRTTNGAADGGSSNLVTAFDITLYDEDGNPVTSGDFDQAREIEVRMESLSPWVKEHAVQQSIWTYTVTPMNLERKVN